MSPTAFVPPDTSPEAWAAQAKVLRRLGPQGRTAIVFRLNEAARELAIAGIRTRHPDYGAGEVRRAWFRLKLGDDVTLAIFPGEKLVDP